MPKRIGKLAYRLKNSAIVKSKSGLALIEFSFSAPILLALGLGGLETANLAAAHMQVSQIAMLVADNSSRVRQSIDEADIREMFTGAHFTGTSIKFSENARLILTSLEENGLSGASEGQMIRWQRCYGANTKYSSSYGAQGDGRYDASLADGIGPIGQKIAAPQAAAINFVEVVYDYQPLVTDKIFGAKVIRYESAFITRERDDQVIKNASGIVTSDLWTCNKYGVIS